MISLIDVGQFANAHRFPLKPLQGVKDCFLYGIDREIEEGQSRFSCDIYYLRMLSYYFVPVCDNLK